MTNEELVKRFFSGRVKGDEESYGLSIKPFLREDVGNFALYSKTNRFPIAAKVSNNLFIVEPKYESKYMYNPSTLRTHTDLVLSVAERMGVGLIFSPKADKANFQGFMRDKINRMLSALAQDLKAHPLEAVLTFSSKYKKLLERIHTLHDGEIQLGLPKNQVTLLDTNGTQALWVWLIKENPNKEDRELLRKTYTLSRLLAPSQKERADSFDIIPWEQMR